jgi:hypothetical protein
MALALVSILLANYFFDRFWYVFISISLTITGLMFWVLLHNADKSFFWLTNWYYIAGVATVYVYRAWRDEDERGTVAWEYVPFWLLALVSLYSSKIYAAVRPEVGGGAPSPIVLYLSATTPLSNSGSAEVLLIDETDKGYYVLTNSDDKTSYFIRRDLVTAIKFSSGRKGPGTKP